MIMINNNNNNNNTTVGWSYTMHLLCTTTATIIDMCGCGFRRPQYR